MYSNFICFLLQNKQTKIQTFKQNLKPDFQYFTFQLTFSDSG